MSAAQLMTDLARLGIRIEAHDDRLRYSPRSAVTPDLFDRMKSHKGELLAILRGDPEAADLTNAAQVWQAALDRLDGDPLFPPARWVDDPEAGETDDSIEVIDPPDPCTECGTLELWQSLTGKWRCLQCNPPKKAQRLREQAARLKTDRTDSPRSTQAAIHDQSAIVR